ncbi:MAG TPA: DUF3108 domain-containing protein [Hyphomicrobiales bacterium]|nr:DUF3108 domain-containing protein [Hyphomicrobiales bacterium]
MQKFLVTLLALCLPLLAWADLPEPFMVRYNASYGSLSAESWRSLSYDADNKHYVMQAQTRLTLLGGNLSSIDEHSEFLWNGTSAVPLHYRYEQKGLGARRRSADFDYANATLSWSTDGKSGSLPLTDPVYDDLNSFMEIRRQLMQGRELIEFEVMDKNEVKPYRFQVLGKEMLDTPLGKYEAVHLERLRDPKSERVTEFWLASDMDYLLLKLRQIEPDGRLIELNAREIERGEPSSS